MPRGGKRPGAGRPKGATREAKAAKAITITQQNLGADNPLLVALNGLGDEYGALDFLKVAYRCKGAPLEARFVAAAKAVPFETAKPTANRGQGATGVTFNFIRHAKPT